MSDFSYSAPPTVQASNITFSSVTTSSIRISVTRGNGSRRIFVVSQHSTSTPVTIADPVDFSSGYQASSDWNNGSPSGTDINSGDQNDYIVYDGTGRYVTLTNLVAGAYYTVKVFEYNGTGFATAEYLTSNGSSGNPRTTNITPSAPSDLTVSNVSSTQFQAGWTDPTGVFDGYEFRLDGTNNTSWADLIEGYDPADLGEDANPLIVEDLDSDEDYFWQIRSKSGYRYSSWTTYSQAVTTLPNPPTISSPPDAICYNTTATIDPDDIANYQFRFYDASTGGNRLDAGGPNAGVDTWETPQLTQTTDYWVSSFNTSTLLESDTRTQVTVQVTQLPDFTNNHPSNATVCQGSSHQFSSTPTNADEYKWQRYDGINYQDIDINTDGGIYSGFNTTSLYISDVTGLDGYQYRLLARNNGCPESWVASNPAELLVPDEPDFTDAHPENAEVCNGGNHVFISDPFFANEYKWQRDAGSGFEDVDVTTDGGVYSGFNTAELTISDVSGLDGYQYRLLARNNGCPTNWGTSDPAELTILYPPTFVQHPQNLEACENATNQTFSAVVNGTDNPLTYQWQRSTDGQQWEDIEENMDGIVYSGFTSTTLTLSVITQTLNGYQYKLLASNSCQSNFSSNVATLTVKTAPSIVSDPENYDGCVNGNAEFSVQVSGTAPFTYQWMMSTNNGNNWSNLEDGSDVSGSTTANLQLSNLTADMDEYQFKVVVSNDCESGIESNVAILNIIALPEVDSHPSDQIVCEGQSAQFTAAFNGDNLNYRWKYSTDGNSWSIVPDNDLYDGVNTTTLTLNEGFITGTMDGYFYKLEAQNDCTSPDWNDTDPAQLIVNDKPIALMTGNGPLCEGEDAIFTISLTGTPPFSVVYFDGLINQQVNNINDYEYQIVINNADETLTYKIISVTDQDCTNNEEGQSVTINVSPYPTLFNLTGDETYCEGTNGVTLQLSSSETGVSYQLYKNSVAEGQAIDGTGDPIQWFNNTSGTYTVVAYNTLTNCSNNMNGEITVNELPAPTVYEFTGETEYCQGENGVTLTLEDSDLGFTYQLFKNGDPEGDPLAGTGDALTWVNSLEGTYYVVSTNDNTGCSTTMNGQISVTEKDLPIAEIVGDPIRNVCVDSDVTLSAVEVDGATYQWLFNGLEILDATESSYTIEGIQVFDEGDYSVVVTKDGCVNTSNIVEIVVQETPSQLGQFTAGEEEVCQGTENVEYTVPLVDGIDYSWEYSGDGVEIIGNGNSVMLNFGENATSGDLAVIAVNSCGSSLPRIMSVVVNPLPSASAGSNSPVCESNTIELSASGGVTYQWTGPDNFESTEQNPEIENATASNAGEYTVNIVTESGCVKTLVVNVEVNPTPQTPGNFTQYTETVSIGQSNVTYTVPNMNGVTFNWSYSGNDVTINGSGNSVTLDFGEDATSGTLSVTTSNDCGESDARSLDITVTGPYLTISEIETQYSGEAFDITVTAMNNDEEYNVSEDTPISITVQTGSGTVSGSGTITEGNSSVVISVTYTNNNGEVGVQLKADNNGGEAFEAGVSNEFKVIAAQPISQAFNISFYDVSSSQMTIMWNKGTGSGSFVVARVSSAVNVTPTTGVEYDDANNNYSSAPSIGSPSDNNKIVYWGTDDSFTMTGLSAITRYHIRIWGYNGNPGLGTENFYFGTGTGNPASQRTARFRDVIAGEDLSLNALFEVGEIVPNPAKDKISFNLQVFENIAFNIEVYNMAGEKIIVAMDNVELPLGTKSIEIPFSNIAAGEYLVKVTAGNEMVIIPFILMP